MNTIHKQAFLPNLQTVCDEMLRAGWACRGQISGDVRFRGVRLYHGQPLREQMLYVLDSHWAERFPVDSFPYISAGVIPGKADHICCVERSPRELLEFVQTLQETFRDQKEQMDRLLLQDAGLNALCALGEELLGNPIFIHDDWFVIIAKSPSASRVLPKETHQSSALEYVPNQWLEDFKLDREYQETYRATVPSIWYNSSRGDSQRGMYVNLAEGPIYRGRLLVMEYNRPFRPGDFLLAELLHDAAMVILRCRQRNPKSKIRSMDNLVARLLEGDAIPASDESDFLSALHWNGEDPMLCIRLERQQRDDTALLEHVLHAALFEQFPHSYILYNADQQCVILNLGKNNQSISMLRHSLSPLCRDYFHYAGISSPVQGIRELHIAYDQAGVALERAFRNRDANWVVPFSACALDYMLTHLKPPAELRHLIAPQLLQLMDYDRAKGTQFFETLRTFLLNERNVPRTSEALIIHRTTLLYRLEKIQSIIGISLEDPDTRLYLLLSLKMMEQDKHFY